MKIFTLLNVAFLLLISTTPAHAFIAKSYDENEACDLFRVVRSDENGIPGKMEINETLYLKNEVFGLSFKDMEIDFEKRLVKVQPVAVVILGYNIPLTFEKVAIMETNNDFNFLINQINRKLFVFEKVCINRHNQISYARMFETQKTEVPSL